MKVWLALILLAMLCAVPALAETPLQAFDEAEVESLYQFAGNYDAEGLLRSIYESATLGKLPGKDMLLDWLQNQLNLQDIFRNAVSLLPCLLLTALLHASLCPNGNGAGFIMRLVLISGFSELAVQSLDTAERCLETVCAFLDIAAPLLTSLFASMSMPGTASLVSPAAALAGNIAGRLLSDYGLPLCRLALCIAIAGNLGGGPQLNRFTRLLRKTAAWVSGLSITVFTALLAVQGSISAGLDSVTLRTAKYAVDSVSSVIGSGVSDAWDSYISGLRIARNAVGVTGITAILAAGLRPLLNCIVTMLVLQLSAALLNVFHEKETADVADEISGICQMGLSLCTAAMAIAMVMFGAAMSIGIQPSV